MNLRMLVLVLTLLPTRSFAAGEGTSGCNKIEPSLFKINDDRTINYTAAAYYRPNDSEAFHKMKKAFEAKGISLEATRVDARTQSTANRLSTSSYTVYTDKNTKKVLWITRTERALTDELKTSVKDLINSIAGDGTYGTSPSAINYVFDNGSSKDNKCHLAEINALVDGQNVSLGNVKDCRDWTNSVPANVEEYQKRRAEYGRKSNEALNDINSRTAKIEISKTEIGAFEDDFKDLEKGLKENFAEGKKKIKEKALALKKKMIKDDEIFAFMKKYHKMCLAFPEIMEEIKNEYDRALSAPVKGPQSAGKVD